MLYQLSYLGIAEPIRRGHVGGGGDSLGAASDQPAISSLPSAATGLLKNTRSNPACVPRPVSR